MYVHIQIVIFIYDIDGSIMSLDEDEHDHDILCSRGCNTNNLFANKGGKRKIFQCLVWLNYVAKITMES